MGDEFYIVRNAETKEPVRDSRGVTVYWNIKSARRTRNECNRRGALMYSNRQVAHVSYEVVSFNTNEGTVVE